MKVYEYKGFPNPARVRIALAEKGMLDQVEFVHVDVPGGEHRLPEFVAKNPWAAVPLLELADGTCISECTAITEYLDNSDNNPVLTGKTARERAVIHMMQRRAESGLLDAAVAYFHHATPGLGPKIETYQNKEWGEYQAKRAVEGMRYLDSVLATQPYLAGETFSMADITAFAGVNVSEYFKIAIPAELVHLKEWRERVAARPSSSAA
jgi:glutathione S-transferase